MGYTHYFPQVKNVPDTQWETLCAKVREAFGWIQNQYLPSLYEADFPVTICDGPGEQIIKGRLLYISWIKIDGQLVYCAPKKENPAAQEQTAHSEPDVPMPAGEPAQPAPLSTVAQIPATPGHSSEISAECFDDMAYPPQMTPAQAPAETADSF